MASTKQPRRRIPRDNGLAALSSWKNSVEHLIDAKPETVKTAVRFALEELASRAPGHSVEVRVPPYGVTQCVKGLRHTRGTPPNVVETDSITWLRLVTGITEWPEETSNARIRVSGTRADLSALLPLFREDQLRGF